MAKPSVRLFDLKTWLTLEDAARHLSVLFCEEVAVADVLRLALDGHLTLSINLVNKARARNGRLIALKRRLIDPSETQVNVSSAGTRGGAEAKEPWNGEFYVSYGSGRSWNDARHYGYISAGGGTWYP